jgi:hypothetical protein
MTTPQPGELLIASIIQALLDIREELFTMNKTLTGLVNCLEGEKEIQVKEVNSQVKDFFTKKERT